MNCPVCATALHHVARTGSHVVCPRCSATLVVTASGFRVLSTKRSYPC